MLPAIQFPTFFCNTNWSIWRTVNTTSSKTTTQHMDKTRPWGSLFTHFFLLMCSIERPTDLWCVPANSAITIFISTLLLFDKYTFNLLYRVEHNKIRNWKILLKLLLWKFLNAVGSWVETGNILVCKLTA